ncbi:MAG TPA: four helix bundle protein [Candidatus Angelobacter sp.]
MIDAKMSMTPEQLRDRTKAFALRIIRLFRSLPDSRDAQVIGNQLLRSGTSVGANYRAVCRSRSKAEFIARLGIVIEEADESVYWLELLVETKVIKEEKLDSLLAEARELTAIFNASRNTMRKK